MARLTLTVQTITQGLSPTYTAIVAADDAQFVYDPNAFLHIRNTTVGAIILTLPTNEMIDTDLDVPDRTISIAATPGAKFTKKLDKDIYMQTDGYVYLNSPTDGLEIAVLKLP
jgi:hypothetical protein